MNANKIECPHCHAMTSTESGFCDECGLELTSQALKPITAAQAMASGEIGKEERSKCPFCGFALRPNARHCPNCGKKLPRNTQPEPVADESLAGSILKPGLVIAER